MNVWDASRGGIISAMTSRRLVPNEGDYENYN